MVVEQEYVRLVMLATAVAVLALLRAPLETDRRPGSRGFLVILVGASAWLASEGLTYFLPGRSATLALYNVLLLGIVVTVLGVLLLAYEYSAQRIASRRALLAFTAVAAGYLVLLWTNFVWLHDLVYTADSYVENAVLVPDRGPAFWALNWTSHGLVVLSIGLFAREFVGAAGLRRRQSALLACSLLPAAAANVYWLYAGHDLGWDPTPLGVVLGVTMLGVALYRTSVLDLVPVARRTVVEEMPDAVVTLDAQGRVLDWNAAAVELFGVDEPSVGMSMAAFFSRLDGAAREALRGAEPIETSVAFEHDGRQRHCSVQISPIELDGAGGTGCVCTFRDITSTVRREHQLVDANDALDEFAEIVSHDVQGPLMELRGSADVALATGDVDQVGHVLHGVDRMEALVDDMLELARSGQRIDDTGLVSLETAAAAAWRSVWTVDAELVVEDDVEVRADPDRLQQLLENCFRNAVEHGSTSPRSPPAREDAVEHGSTSPDSASPRQDAVEHGSTSPPSTPSREDVGGRDIGGGDVGGKDVGERRSSSPDSKARQEAGAPEGAVAPGGGGPTVRVGALANGFFVADDGPGIPPADRDRVFERGVSGTEDGTGLGLGIVRQIVEAHGWTVRITAAVDGGARFEFTEVERRP